MTLDRPNPDELLSQVRAEEAESKRGNLKIFFGYAAGVGKTYAMLEAARKVLSAKREVVVGYVEPHGRTETEALLVGLESLDKKSVTHAGVTLREFDVDAALQRHPDLLLVDELAHTNAPGSRHAKRWQDVVELLEAGINVWTTLNVQHIESLNDIIGQITGVNVRETVPDHVFDLASDLELADVTPEELLTRLKDGKIYLPAQAARAVQNFFQKANLVALRELSLRQTAKRLHTDVESARRERSTQQPWATADRLLVCVGPSPTTARVIRTAKRLAAALDAPWLAVAVEQPGIVANPQAAQQVADHLRLAKRLGAETVTLSGENVAQTIVAFARNQNVTKLFIGKTQTNRWSRWFRYGVVDQLLAASGEIDVYVIQGMPESRASSVPNATSPSFAWGNYLAATAIVGAASGLAAILDWYAFAEANIVMMLLAAVVFSAYLLGRGPAVWSSILAVVIFDVVFVPPRGSLTVDDTQYLFTFAVMLLIGVLISTLTARLQVQLKHGRQRERYTLALYRLGKQLSSLNGEIFLATAAAKHLREMFGGEVVIYLRDVAKPGVEPLPRIIVGEETSIAKTPVSLSTAQWVISRDHMAGRGTDTLPNAPALFVPLTGSQEPFGAIAVRAERADDLLQPEPRSWLENCASQLALALERDRMMIEASDARIQAEAESVRNTLLSGLSHDLKTPLAAIAGASSTLIQLDPSLSGTRRELLDTISDEAIRLNQLLENILQISRLDAGAAKPNKQWHLLEEIVGLALHRAKPLLAPRRVVVQIPQSLPLLFVDGVLLEQVFWNLFENAARYTPPESEVSVVAQMTDRSVAITVGDTGPGLSVGTERRIFDKYYRGSSTPDASRGSGLGLAICHAIVSLHGGTIVARNRPTGGTEFVIELPRPDNPPNVSFA